MSSFFSMLEFSSSMSFSSSFWAKCCGRKSTSSFNSTMMLFAGPPFFFRHLFFTIPNRMIWWYPTGCTKYTNVPYCSDRALPSLHKSCFEPLLAIYLLDRAHFIALSKGCSCKFAFNAHLTLGIRDLDIWYLLL